MVIVKACIVNVKTGQVKYDDLEVGDLPLVQTPPETLKGKLLKLLEDPDIKKAILGIR